MAIYLERNSKITIPTNPPFNVEYKGAKFIIEQDFYFEGGDIYINIPNTLHQSTESGSEVLSKSHQRNNYNLSHIKPEQVLICDLRLDDKGCAIVIPNLTTTSFVQERLRQGKPVNLADMCFQFSEDYDALDQEGEVSYVRSEHLKSVNSWLSGDYYQIKPTCEKWEHVASYTGSPMSECIYQIQWQVDEPPSYMVREEELRAFDRAIERNNSLMDQNTKEQLRKAHERYVDYHNDFVDRWKQM